MWTECRVSSCEVWTCTTPYSPSWEADNLACFSLSLTHTHTHSRKSFHLIRTSFWRRPHTSLPVRPDSRQWVRRRRRREVEQHQNSLATQTLTNWKKTRLSQWVGLSPSVFVFFSLLSLSLALSLPALTLTRIMHNCASVVISDTDTYWHIQTNIFFLEKAHTTFLPPFFYLQQWNEITLLLKTNQWTPSSAGIIQHHTVWNELLASHYFRGSLVVLGVSQWHFGAWYDNNGNN